MAALNASAQVGSDLIGGTDTPPDLHMAVAVTQMGFTSMAALASLSFVIFDPTRNNQVVESVHIPLDWTGQEGREIHPAKMKWALGLSTVARKVMVDKNPQAPNVAIGKLITALSTHKPKVVWGYPTDIGMLTNFMMMAGVKPPWGEVGLRDPNTLVKSGIELGLAKPILRGEFEPEGHSLGDTSFIVRNIRSVYAPDVGVLSEVVK